MKRKIDRMHELFGRLDGYKCKDCHHLSGGPNKYKKCDVYGDTRSEATDWALSYTACGLFNKPYKGDIPIIRAFGRKKEDIQIEGQMSLWQQ